MDTSKPILELNQLQPKLGDAHLKLQLETEVKSILPLEQIQEVSLIPIEQVTFIPSMAKCVLGLVHRRNRVIWIIDLPQMLGLTPINHQTNQYQVAIAKLGKMSFGLVVRQIQEIIRLSTEEISSLMVENNANEVGSFKSNISLSLIPYLRGWVQQPEEILLVLDTEAIFNAPILHNK